jgi:8-oxo-dGTP pyrophosphatase MutT (NUDIX family)
MSDPTSLRATVIESVRARQPVDDRERDALATCLARLRDLPAPFDRAADPVHVTGSGIITGPDGVLLLEHRRLRIWVQPGGHLEDGETPWEAARRESIEETGLRLALVGGGRDEPRLVHVDVHPSAGGHTHLDLRYALVVEGDTTPRPPAGESQEVRWYPWSEAIAVADPGLSGLLRHLAPSTAR